MRGVTPEACQAMAVTAGERAQQYSAIAMQWTVLAGLSVCPLPIHQSRLIYA